MNRQRRKRLNEAWKLVEQASDILQEVKDEEYESKENLPDNFKYGERGDEMDGYIEMLDETIGLLLDANSVIEQI